MQKYGLVFEPFMANPEWLVAEGFTPGPDVDYSDSLAKLSAKIQAIHKRYKPRTDFVFAGSYRPEAKTVRTAGIEYQHCPTRIFLISNQDVADVARDFELGSHDCIHSVEHVYETLQMINAIAKFAPTYIDVAGLNAFFLDPIELDQASEILEVLEAQDFPGIGFQDGELDPMNFVRDQGFELWWD